METVTAFQTYQKLLSHLLVQRALAPLSQDEEAERAAQRMELWEQLSEGERVELENWIESQMNPPKLTGQGIVEIRDVKDPDQQPRAAA